MPKKPKMIQEIKLTSPHEARITLEKDPSIQLLIACLLLGKQWEKSRFFGHTAYIARMRLAHNNEQPDEFLKQMKLYLRDASRSVPNMPKEERVKEAVTHLEWLIVKYGTRQVTNVLLARMLN